MLHVLSANWLLITLLLVHVGVISFLIPKIILQNRESGATLAWILTILFLPVIGVLTFWILGTTRVRILSKRRHRAEQHLVPSLTRFRQLQQLSASDEMVATSLYSLATKLDDCGPQPGCVVTMYRNGGQAFDAIEEAIDAAQHHIHMIYYEWSSDQTGRRFLDALIRAAERGIEVRVLIDDVGSYLTTSNFFALLVDAGGEVARFMPLNPLSRQFSVNHRNHRKMAIIDGKLGFTGSMNIGDLYAGLKKPWNDLHLCAKGRVVYELQRVFCQDWYFTTDQDLATDRYFPEHQCQGDVCAHFLASGPADQNWRTIHTLLFSAISLARERVWIETPYFVPDAAVTMALQSAALRGVDVRLLLPSQSDHPLVVYAGRSFFDELLSVGVKIFEIKNTIPHAKTVIVDQVFSTAGSANMDQRSFRLNFEGNLFFFGKRIVAEMEASFKRFYKESHEVTLAERALLPRGQKLREGFARVLAPLL